MNEVAATFNKIHALGDWAKVCGGGNSWMVKPHGVALPYFCVPTPGDNVRTIAEMRIYEGWRTLHNLLMFKMDRNMGYVSSHLELTQFMVIKSINGVVDVCRCDPGYVPFPPTEAQSSLVARILWESYGIVLRLESDPTLTTKYANEGSILGRVEYEPGKWRDEVLKVPPPMPYTEKVMVRKDDFNALKKLPLVRDASIDFDFMLDKYHQTQDKRPRFVYNMILVDSKTSQSLYTDSVSIGPNIGLHELWEDMPQHLVGALIYLGYIPNEIRVRSGRVFRLIKIIGLEIPVKISLHDQLPALEAAMVQGCATS